MCLENFKKSTLKLDRGVVPKIVELVSGKLSCLRTFWCLPIHYPLISRMSRCEEKRLSFKE